MRLLDWPLLVYDDAGGWEKWKRALRGRKWRAPKTLRDRDYKGVVFGWRSLAQLAERFEGQGCAFRGQAKKYPLVPKIGRPDARKSRKDGKPAPYNEEWEKRILYEFELRSPPYLTISPGNSLEWMAVARHHGLPTRLLDWTESFLVAAMFACSNSGVVGGKYQNAEICVLKALPAVDHGSDPFEIREISSYRSRHITPRIPAQRGLFTVHPNPPEPADHLVERWLICSEGCFNIKKMLNVVGINESTIQPDMDGLGKYLEWCYKWSVRLGHETEPVGG